MYTIEGNLAMFNLEKEMKGYDTSGTAKRVYDLENFNMAGVDFEVAHTIFPLRFNVLASKGWEASLSTKRVLGQLQEYLLTGKENDFYRRYVGE